MTIAICDEICPNYHHVESCQETVPEAFYGLPEQFKDWAIELTKADIHEVMKEFDKHQIPAKRLEA